MAVVKRFFFDGEEIREEVIKKPESDKNKKPEDKKLEERKLEGKRPENKNSGSRNLENRMPEGKKLESRNLENRMPEGKKLESRNLENRMLEGKKLGSRNLESRMPENRNLKSKILESKKLESKRTEKQKSPADGGEVRMLVSSLLKKDGKPYARVSFLRGEDIAEGIVPDGTLEHVSGFSEEEVAGLKFYLTANKEAILAQARQIDPLTNWLRKSSLSQ